MDLCGDDHAHDLAFEILAIQIAVRGSSWAGFQPITSVVQVGERHPALGF